MSSPNPLVVEVPADEYSEIQKAKKIPRRILHFSDGTLEEYSTDEDEGIEPKCKQQDAQQLATVDPKTLPWGPWFWYQSSIAGFKTLEVCDYLGESLANFFGITTPKYQYEIESYKKMKAEEEKLKKEQETEMSGWVSKPADYQTDTEATVSEPPSTQRLLADSS